ncbi:putative phopshatase/sulfatase [Klebsiella pneumoniae]|uniref:Putative phopshatase/sulfatase n=1 Tax=Klebsiella pneumoniae TaxID=573 RepID=A0A2X3I043_KLEPN|nr:putative phopshatase/sulfatase [Klebsiella pneumoniae]
MLTVLREAGKLDNTVVIITGGHGKPLNAKHDAFDWSREQLQVPLVIHWPGTPAQEIATLTDNKDVMTTLMQRLLHVSTPANEYSQGEDLFSAARRRNWVTAANGDTLAITTRPSPWSSTITAPIPPGAATARKLKIRNRSSACCCRS